MPAPLRLPSFDNPNWLKQISYRVNGLIVLETELGAVDVMLCMSIHEAEAVANTVLAIVAEAKKRQQ